MVKTQIFSVLPQIFFSINFQRWGGGLNIFFDLNPKIVIYHNNAKK
jgi:hypothetical protein